MKVKSKKCWPKKHARISIQIWTDRSGTDCIGVTYQRSRREWCRLNAFPFGQYLATNPLFNKGDLKFLEMIFGEFLKVRKKENEPKSRNVVRMFS